MKTEKEIRRHIANLRKAVRRPCNCAKTGHAAECLLGDAMMQSAIVNLSWVVGDAEGYDRVVENLDAEIKRRG